MTPHRFSPLRMGSSGFRPHKKRLGAALLGGCAGLLITSLFAHVVLAQDHPEWLVQSVGKVDTGTLGAAISSQLPIDAASTKDQTAYSIHPLISLIRILSGATLTNPTSLLGKIPGISNSSSQSSLKSPLNSASTVPVSIPKSALPTSQTDLTDKSLSASSVKPVTPTGTDTAVTLPLVYIYQTHSWESFLPELGKKDLTSNQAHDQKINITLVGARLADLLNSKGVPTVQTRVDYWAGGYNAAFDNSRKTVTEELKKYPSIQIVFDLHRDDGPRELTTTSYQGKSVARVLWIIGGTNPNYNQNENFAKQLDGEFKKLYPADTGQKPISRGIEKQFYPDGSEFNSLFNQDLKPNDVLIEIGGPYNTLQECYATAEAVATVIQKTVSDLRLSPPTSNITPTP